jgi:hypothetical protein
MAIEFKATKHSGHMPEIWRGEAKMLPAGFKPANTLEVGMVLHRGTPVSVDFENRTAAVCKAAKVLAGGTTSAPRVAKGLYFAVGDSVSKLGGAAATIKSIDRTNVEYDVLTLSAAITGLAEGDTLVESASAGVAKYVPNAVVGAVLEVNANAIPTIDVAYEAVVLYPSLATAILADWLNGFCLKLNPNILFIKQ